MSDRPGLVTYPCPVCGSDELVMQRVALFRPGEPRPEVQFRVCCFDCDFGLWDQRGLRVGARWGRKLATAPTEAKALRHWERFQSRFNLERDDLSTRSHG
jgi:hypothetical protein